MAATTFLLHTLLLSAPTADPGRLEYNRDVRPILANNCFKCHGPDAKERQAGLRLDVRDEALKPNESGRRAIVPGKPAASTLVSRVTAGSAKRVMPPPDSNKSLTDSEKELLRRWIEEGAEYQPHWAFLAPKRPSLPPGDVAHPVDRFVHARLAREGWKPAAEADRVTLVRRLTLDLTGLPPTPAEVDAAVADTSPQWYEKVVDRLFASPHYGERLALDWLDVARFADTHGYHLDSGRDMTRWREWVIDAFQRNLPYDQFTVTQLAGDLLPQATLAQKIASGFNRNHMINFEGGAIPKEYHNAYIVDRVNTTATAWLGLTVACAQCHDHKYDPITQKEYYRLYAFFHNVPENGLDGSRGNAAPLLKAPTPAQQAQLDELAKKLADAERRQAKDEVASLKKELAGLEKALPTAMVMQEMPTRRETFLLLRGQYDKPGEKVTAGVPAMLPALSASQPTRLDLARWLVQPEHPLTARVAVNRYWQMLFGVGLVKTSEDFGIQGELASHPELLDWLAVEWVRPSDPQGTPWDVKRLLRLMVTSATYRQTSALPREAYLRDPENRLLARGPRFRLQAEFIRDLALAASGLLNRDVGGPSVFPYQPAGLWRELTERNDSKNWSAQFYTQSQGRDLYRRGMYTFWKRTSPPPTLLTFDAPDRESCTVRRSRTNTPLQALALLNDPTFVEASRKLAERLLREAKTTEERIVLGYRLTTARQPNERERKVLTELFEKQRAELTRNRAAAEKLLNVGESKRDEKLAVAELAAWTTIASVLLNLDETVTRN